MVRNQTRIEGIIDTNLDRKGKKPIEVPFVNLPDILEPALIVITFKDQNKIDKIYEQVAGLNSNVKIIPYKDIYD